MKLRYIFSMLLLSLAFVACDDDAIRIPDIDNGVQVRVQFNPEFNYVDFANLNAAKIVFDIFSENTDLDSVIISFDYRPVVGAARPFTQVKVFRQSDFVNGKISDVEVTFNQLATIFGLDIADISGGDIFTLSNRVVNNKGISYPGKTPLGTDNIEPGILGSSNTNSFTTILTVYVLCPLNAPFTGSYLLEQTSELINWNGGGNMFSTGNVNLSQGSNPIIRNFAVRYLGFADRAFQMILLCDDVIVPDFLSAGLSCGGGTPTMGFGGFNPATNTRVRGTYTQGNDSEIFIEIFENPLGGCGRTPVPVSIRLTKN